MRSTIIPGFTIFSRDGEVVDVYEEVTKTVNRLFHSPREGVIDIDEVVFEAIMQWAKTGYAGLSLSEYLDKLFGDDAL